MEMPQRPMRIKEVLEDGLFSGETQVALQTFLVSHDCTNLKIDGNFSYKSIRALQTFLDAHAALPVDGHFGAMTIGALQKFLGRKNEWLEGQKVKVDGKIGKETVQALQNFLRVSMNSPDLEVNGKFDAPTQVLLQTFLEVQGFPPGAKDGVWDWQSNGALCRFLNAQKVCFIFVDGEWAMQTTYALQTFLKAQGHKILIDGSFGEQTIRTLQRHLNICIQRTTTT